MVKVFTHQQVSQHRTAQSCWVVLYGHVYDVTKLLPQHPGGADIVLQLAGTDATEEYDPVHPNGTLEASESLVVKLGAFDHTTLPRRSTGNGEAGDNASAEAVPPLEDMLNLDDIEQAATKVLSRKAWAYYYSAADDLRSKSWNNLAYQRILLRPRVFLDVSRCTTATTLLGHHVDVPVYVSPAAMARLAHPSGEHGIAQACARFGALQIISNNASQTPEEIVANAPSEQIFGWQLYVQTVRSKSEAMLVRVAKLPNVKFVCLTLDAPVAGKREHDERTKNVSANLPIRSAVQTDNSSSGQPAQSGGGGVGRALFAGTAADLTWQSTLPWLARHTSLPIVLKGIQTHEDAYIASLHAPLVRAIILSNHGGRAADTAPPAVHTLMEIRKYCPEVFQRVEVWVDGGIKRGTDVVKALCLGAKAVGMGRSPLFGLGAGGVAGVERVLGIIKSETETAMRLLGVERVDQLGSQHINARAVERDIYDGPAALGDLHNPLAAKL